MKEINMQINLTDHNCKDLFITAIEGGINYWALINNYNHENCVATIIDKEGPQPAQYNVNLLTIRQGFEKLFAENSKWSNEKIFNILNENYDAEDADVILQYGLFGEIIYG